MDCAACGGVSSTDLRCGLRYHTLTCSDQANLVPSGRLLSKNVKIKMYRTIILPVVLCGCETWSLTLREERRLSVFEKGVEENIWA